MLFFSDSRLIFQIVVGGRFRLVEFSETGVNHCSTFQTSDEAVIEAIHKHKFFRMGKIRESAEPKVEEPKVRDEALMEFGSYSQLKSYLRKTFKDDSRSSKIKTPKDVAAFAAEKGVVYRFTNG